MARIKVYKNEYTGNWLWYCFGSSCNQAITSEPDSIYQRDRESQQSALKGGLRHLQEYHSEKSSHTNMDS